MAYTTIPEVEIAAGGPKALSDLADLDENGKPDEACIRQAQRDADSWIDSYARRLYSIPFDPVPSAIRAIAAMETVYRLKQYRRIVTDMDRADRKERDDIMQAMMNGKWDPVDVDPYPIGPGGGGDGSGGGTNSPTYGAGGGVPFAGVYESDDDSVMTRTNLKGYW